MAKKTQVVSEVMSCSYNYYLTPPRIENVQKEASAGCNKHCALTTESTTKGQTCSESADIISCAVLVGAFLGKKA